MGAPRELLELDAFMQHCVGKVAPKKGKDAAFAICKATGNKAGYYKAGTKDLTAKGKKAVGKKQRDPEHKEKKMDYERAIGRAEEGVLGELDGYLEEGVTPLQKEVTKELRKWVKKHGLKGARFKSLATKAPWVQVWVDKEKNPDGFPKKEREKMVALLGGKPGQTSYGNIEQYSLSMTAPQWAKFLGMKVEDVEEDEGEQLDEGISPKQKEVAKAVKAWAKKIGIKKPSVQNSSREGDEFVLLKAHEDIPKEHRAKMVKIIGGKGDTYGNIDYAMAGMQADQWAEFLGITLKEDEDELDEAKREGNIDASGIPFGYKLKKRPREWSKGQIKKAVEMLARDNESHAGLKKIRRYQDLIRKAQMANYREAQHMGDVALKNAEHPVALRGEDLRVMEGVYAQVVARLAKFARGKKAFEELDGFIEIGEGCSDPGKKRRSKGKGKGLGKGKGEGPMGEPGEKDGMDERIGDRPKEFDFDGQERKKVVAYLEKNYPKFKKARGSKFSHLVPIPVGMTKNADGEEMITFRHMSSPDLDVRGLPGAYVRMFGLPRNDVWHRQSGNWEFVIAVFPTGTLAKMLPSVKMEDRSMEEAKEKTDPKLKGKKATGNGFRPKARKGSKFTLTGKMRWAYAGRGYEYEMKGSDGETIWLDASGFEMKEDVELDEAKQTFVVMGTFSYKRGKWDGNDQLPTREVQASSEKDAVRKAEKVYEKWLKEKKKLPSGAKGVKFNISATIAEDVELDEAKNVFDAQHHADMMKKAGFKVTDVTDEEVYVESGKNEAVIRPGQGGKVEIKVILNSSTKTAEDAARFLKRHGF